VVAIVVAAVVVVSLGGAMYYGYGPRSQSTTNSPPPTTPPDDGNTSPREVARLSEGQTVLVVPMMPMYAAPALEAPGFGTTVELDWSSSSAGPSTNFRFHWDQVTGTSLPVRFVFDPGRVPYFTTGPDNGFVYWPVGLCASPCLRQSEDYLTGMIGAQAAYFAVWRLEYSVHEMQATRNHVSETWLQVNYSLSPRSSGTETIPAENVTLPEPTDLVRVGNLVTLSYAREQSWRYNVSIHDFVLSDMPFRHSLLPAVFDAGVQGKLTAVLTSSFVWGPAEDYRLGLSGTSGVNVTLQFFLDNRFGALLVQYVD
jgi:hypothetical protein